MFQGRHPIGWRFHFVFALKRNRDGWNSPSHAGSGLFPALPPPLPERLSSLLAYQRPIDITGKGWHGIRFAEPIPPALDAREPVIAAVARYVDPEGTWAFRSGDDRSPLRADHYIVPTELAPSNPFASLAQGRDIEVVGFDLAVFDDLAQLLG